MTSIEALITAARRYCQENYFYWADLYTNKRTGQDSPEYAFSNQDYNLFPRYNLLAAIHGELEMLTGKTFSDSSSCREILIKIGTSANSPLTVIDNEIEAAAIEDERNKYKSFIQHISEEELSLVLPLPYRRRLNEEEREAVREQLFEHWNYDGEYWDPLVHNSPAETLYLSKEHFTEADHQSIIDYISTHTQSNLLEVTEDRTDTEIELSEFHPDCYETIYCDYTYSWLIYGSHESTITFAGEALIAFVRQLFTGREHLFNQSPYC